MNRTLFCLARNYGQASVIVRELEVAGFAQNVISLLPSSRRGSVKARFAGATKAPEGIAWGLGLGGFAGALTGYLAGTGELALPSFAPLVAAGGLMALLGGLALGSLLGGVFGGIVGVGLPEIEARPAPPSMPDNYLVSVVVESEPGAGHVRKIFVRRGGRCISESAPHQPQDAAPWFSKSTS